MPFPKQKQPPKKSSSPDLGGYNPVLKGRHVNRVLEMAQESGRHPNDIMNEALDHALGLSTDSRSAPTPSPAPARATPAAAPAPRAGGKPVPLTPGQTTARPDGTQIARATDHVQPPNGPPLGETIAARKRREAGDDDNGASASDDTASPSASDDNAASASDETDNAPPEKMKGDQPNPLDNVKPVTNPLKRWARGEGGTEPSFLDPKNTTADDADAKKAALRRKHLAYAGKVQKRG